MLAGLMGGWMETYISGFWMKNSKKVSSFTTKPRMTLSFNKIMTPSTHAKRPPPGSKTIIMKSYHGLHSLQILILLNICGVTSRKGWQIMRFHLEEFWSYGTKYRWNGTRYSRTRGVSEESMPRRMEAVIRAKGGY